MQICNKKSHPSFNGPWGALRPNFPHFTRVRWGGGISRRVWPCLFRLFQNIDTFARVLFHETKHDHARARCLFHSTKQKHFPWLLLWRVCFVLKFRNTAQADVSDVFSLSVVFRVLPYPEREDPAEYSPVYGFCDPEQHPALHCAQRCTARSIA